MKMILKHDIEGLGTIGTDISPLITEDRLVDLCLKKVPDLDPISDNTVIISNDSVDFVKEDKDVSENFSSVNEFQLRAIFGQEIKTIEFK